MGDYCLFIVTCHALPPKKPTKWVSVKEGLSAQIDNLKIPGGRTKDKDLSFNALVVKYMHLCSTNPFQQQQNNNKKNNKHTSPHSFSSIFFHSHSFLLFFSNIPISFLFLSLFLLCDGSKTHLCSSCDVHSTKRNNFKWGFLSFSCLWSSLVLLVFSAVDGCVQHIKVVKCALSLSLS